MADLNPLDIRSLILKTTNKFGLQGSEWQQYAYEWVGEGMGIIGVGANIKEQKCFLNYVGNTAKLPCDATDILAVYVGKMRLLPYSRITHLRSHINAGTEECVPDFRFQAEGCWLHSNLPNEYVSEETKMELRYWGIELSEEGYPIIPNDDQVLEALSWFIMYNLKTRGLKHPAVRNFEQAYAMWERHYPRAQNSLLNPDYKDYELITRMWTNLGRYNPNLAADRI